MRSSDTFNCHVSGRFATVVVALLTLTTGTTSRAQAPSQSSDARVASSQRLVDKLARRGDLTLRDATLESALFTISELWGINIVAGGVEGSVNGVFKDAPLREILDSILLSNGYAYRPVGGSLVVSRLSELGQINPFFVSETLPVGGAEVGEVVEAARLMSTPQGQVRALPSAGAILVVDFPDRVAKIRDLVRQLDITTRNLAASGDGPGPGPRQLEVAYFRTHYIPALQAGTALDVVLSTDGRIATVEGEDRLLVVDYPEHIRMVESVLARIDRPRPQVNIKALIYDISLSDMEQIGVNWDALSSGVVDAAGTPTSGSGALVSSVTKAPFDASSPGGAFTFFSMNNNFNLQAVVLALQQAEDSRLLADPNVTVMDNEAANIQSISEIPFQQLTQTTGGGNIGTTAFKEVGIKLDVTPKISRDGTIDMTVVPEFSRLSGFTPGDNQPIVDTRRATTRVRVGNGQTMMIAGLRQRADVGDFDGIPLLKDIRFVGHLFRSRDTQVTESELVVFLTPEIVGYSDPLSERDRLSADTIDCRLDYIPAAEGCPACGGGPEACGCRPTESARSYEAVDVPQSVPAEAVPTPAEAIELAFPAAAEEVETSDTGALLGPAVDVTPLPEVPSSNAMPTNGRAEGSASLRFPSLAQRGVRFLPSVAGGDPTEPLQVMPIVAAGTSDAKAVPTRPMRVDYASRFRATGGVYPDQQRVAERPTPVKTASKPEGKKQRRSFGDWILRR